MKVGWQNRMGWIAVQLNKDAFNFDLTGFHEHFQYTIYDSKNGEQHYDWHIDIGTGTELPRKLSLIVLLSDPKDYKGADLQINTGNITTLEPKFGRVYAFPSYILHRVTPIESGIRKSLVSWISGPDFR